MLQCCIESFLFKSFISFVHLMHNGIIKLIR